MVLLWETDWGKLKHSGKTCSNATVHHNTWTGLGLKLVSTGSRTFIQYSKCLQPTDISLEEITASRLWKKMGPVPKIPRKYSIAKMAILVFFITEEANNIEKKRKKQRRNKVEEQRNRKCTQYLLGP